MIGLYSFADHIDYDGSALQRLAVASPALP
jgi:hypothetical protein